MERNQEEQARQIKELQGQVENDKQRAQIEKSRKDAQAYNRDVKSIACDKGKGPVVPDDVDTPTGDKLSSGRSPSLNLSPIKNTRESTRTRSCKRPSPHLAFSDVVSGASRRARREVGRRQYRLGQAPGNPPVLPLGMLPLTPPAHPAFGTTPTFYVLSTALILRPNDMLSLPLGQHILDYETPRGFAILSFTTFDGSIDPTTFCCAKHSQPVCEGLREPGSIRSRVIQ